MTLCRLNLVCALISLAGSLLLLALNSAPSAFIWFGASVVWFVMAALYWGRGGRVESFGRRVVRRLSRLMMFS
jgi:hypothetical protein